MFGFLSICNYGMFINSSLNIDVKTMMIHHQMHVHHLHHQMQDSS